MPKTNRPRIVFVEVLVDRLILESFPNERAPYQSARSDDGSQDSMDRMRRRIIWHINHTLSKRQKEVLKLYLVGKKEGEIGRILGVKQQVVNIYKKRAVNRLRIVLNHNPVC
ncbi:hypothetical protein TRIP_C21637 [Candidatus Zixiibacteriota bacterium]|nr:hypothetical protein TRIP_C21637 [candidate division Zixibacteria bacterium]